MCQQEDVCSLPPVAKTEIKHVCLVTTLTSPYSNGFAEPELFIYVEDVYNNMKARRSRVLLGVRNSSAGINGA
jgi:hypothetical protein